MSKTELVQTSTLRIGNFLVVDGKPCRITNMSTAKPGKHGSSKTIFITKDVLSGKNVEHSAPSKGMVSVPEIIRDTYAVLDVSDEGFLSLMKNGVIREDVRLPDDSIGQEIKTLLEREITPEIVLMTVLDHNIVLSVRESSETL